MLETRELGLLRLETARLVDSLAGMVALLTGLPDRFPAEITVSDDTLGRIVTSVVGLKPGADAQDIARAVREQLPAGPEPLADELIEVLQALRKEMERNRSTIAGLARQTAGGGPSFVGIRINNTDISTANPLPVTIGEGEPVPIVEEWELDTLHLIPPTTPFPLPPGNNALVGGWVEIGNFGGLEISFSTTGEIEGHIDWSNDDTVGVSGTHVDAVKIVNHTIDSGVVSINSAFYIPRGGKYYRIRADNHEATPTDFTSTTHKVPGEPAPFMFESGGQINDTWKAILTKSVQTGQQPDGDYINARADGLAFQTSTPLGSNASYTSPWFDTDGFRSIEVFIVTDQVSGADGVEIQFTADANAAVPVANGILTREFTADDLARGFAIFRLPTSLDGFRVRYTNGATAQTSFLLVGTLRVYSTELPSMPMTSAISPTQSAIVVRAGLLARNDSDVFDEIRRGPNGGIRLALDPARTIGIGRVSVLSASASQVVVPSGAVSISLKNMETNGVNDVIYVGDTNTVNTGTGYPIGQGNDLVLDVDENAAIWVIGNNNTTLAWVATKE